LKEFDEIVGFKLRLKGEWLFETEFKKPKFGKARVGPGHPILLGKQGEIKVLDAFSRFLSWPDSTDWTTFR